MNRVENLEGHVERLLQRISKHTELRDSLLREVTSFVQGREDLELSLREINEVRYQKLPFCVQHSVSLARSVESSAKYAGRSSFVVKHLDRLLSRVGEAKRVSELIMQMNRNCELVPKALESEVFDTIVKLISSYEEARGLLLHSYHAGTNVNGDGEIEKERIGKNDAGYGVHRSLTFSPLIQDAREKTREKLLLCIEEAAQSNNKPKIMECVCHLKKLNFPNEGLKFYCKWICDHTINSLKEMVDRELKKMDDPTEPALSHLALVSQVLDTIAATFETEEKFTRETFGEEGPILLLTELHNRSTTQCVPVMQDFVERRRHILSMMEHTTDSSSSAPLRSREEKYVNYEGVRDDSTSSGASEEDREVGDLRSLERKASANHVGISSDARQVDQVLEETSHLVSCCQIYMSFMEGKWNDINIVEKKKVNKDTRLSSTAMCSLMGVKDNALLNTMHDILSLYVPLQMFYFNLAFDQAIQLQASGMKEVVRKVRSDPSSNCISGSSGGDAGTNYKIYGSPTFIMAGLSSIYNSAARFGDHHDPQAKRRNREDFYFIHGGKISLIDDVFFFLRIAMHRSLNTNSTQIVSAVVMSAKGIIQSRLLPEIKRHAVLPKPQLKALVMLPMSANMADLQLSSIPALSPPPPSTLKWISAAHQTAEYCSKMAQELRLLTNSPGSGTACGFNASDILRFNELAEDIDIIANELNDSCIRKDWLEKSAQVCWQAVMAPTHIERFIAQSYKTSETTFYHYELKDPWVQACLEDWASMLDYVAEHLDPVLFDSLLALVTAHTVNFIRFVLSRKEFNSFGALQLDKDVRALRSFFTSKAHEVSLREVFAPLSLTSTLLLCDTPRDALEEIHNMALTAKEKKNVLLSRVDFNKKDVLSLNL